MTTLKPIKAALGPGRQAGASSRCWKRVPKLKGTPAQSGGVGPTGRAATTPATRAQRGRGREPAGAQRASQENGRASCRARVCQYLSTSVVPISIKYKTTVTVPIY